MIFTPTSISGVVVVDLDPIEDDRGFFARVYDREEFSSQGIALDAVEMNVSFNRLKGTLRGMHYQAEPHPEPKIVSCLRGSLFDVVVDLRVQSPTYCQWVGMELSAESRKAVHIAAGCAHGFMTLQDATEIHYIMGERYYQDLARGVRWDDPAFGIDWPMQPTVISSRDAGFADYLR
jgi:dTDP-4-dehydrorhamnose 3,5-epimerase